MSSTFFFCKDDLVNIVILSRLQMHAEALQCPLLKGLLTYPLFCSQGLPRVLLGEVMSSLVTTIGLRFASGLQQPGNMHHKKKQV